MTNFDFSNFPKLETERLILRRVTTDDREDWHQLHQNEDVLRYLIDFAEQPPMEEMDEIIGWCDHVFSQKTGMRWAITLKPDDKLIGTCGFHIYDAHNRYAEIGYELNHDYWRQGIMREAVTALLQFLFDQLNLHRVEANVTVGNEASAGLLKDLGFTLEGTWRERVYIRERFWDLWQFSLLEDEYKQV